MLTEVLEKSSKIFFLFLHVNSTPLFKQVPSTFIAGLTINFTGNLGRYSANVKAVKFYNSLKSWDVHPPSQWSSATHHKWKTPQVLVG